MKKENLKLGMKVFYQDDEWKIDEIFKNKVKISKYVSYKTKTSIELTYWDGTKCNLNIESKIVKIKYLKPLDDCQTSINPTMFNTEELVEECYKDYWIVRIFKKIFNLFK